MARTVIVQAVAAFSYAGRSVRAGERVAMPALDALAQHRAGHVSLTRVARTDAPREPAADTPAPRRRYRRRDLEPQP
jgi:hypothetical protein